MYNTNIIPIKTKFFIKMNKSDNYKEIEFVFINVSLIK